MKYYINEYAKFLGDSHYTRREADQWSKESFRIALLIITKTPNRPATFKRIAVKKASKK